MTKAEFEAFEKKVQCWLASPEGRKALEETLRISKGIAKELEQARQINPADLHKPMTI